MVNRHSGLSLKMVSQLPVEIKNTLYSIGLAISLITTPVYADGNAQKSGTEIQVPDINNTQVSEFEKVFISSAKFLGHVSEFIAGIDSGKVTQDQLISFTQKYEEERANLTPEVSTSIRDMIHQMYRDMLKNGYTVTGADQLDDLTETLTKLGSYESVLWGETIGEHVDFTSEKVITFRLDANNIILETQKTSLKKDEATSSVDMSVLVMSFSKDMSTPSKETLGKYRQVVAQRNVKQQTIVRLNSRIAQQAKRIEILESAVKKGDTAYSELEVKSANDLRDGLRKKDELYKPQIAEKVGKIEKLTGKITDLEGIISRVRSLLPDRVLSIKGLDDAVTAAFSHIDSIHANELKRIKAEHTAAIELKNAEIAGLNSTVESLGEGKIPETVAGIPQAREKELLAQINKLKAENDQLNTALNAKLFD